MDNQIKEIAERLQGLRDVLELSSAEFAQQAGLDQQEYEKAETGESDISVSMLQRISRKLANETLLYLGKSKWKNT